MKGVYKSWERLFILIYFPPWDFIHTPTSLEGTQPTLRSRYVAVQSANEKFKIIWFTM
jgi:hypothetical protein